MKSLGRFREVRGASRFGLGVAAGVADEKPQSYVAKVEGLERRLDVIEFLMMAGAVGLDPIPAIRSAWREVQASQE